MKRYCITGGGDVLALVASNLNAGVDMVQIREKALSGRALSELVRAVLKLPNPQGTKILVNERLDVALACGADGVHLPANSISVAQLRTVVPTGFLIGVSTHVREEVLAAAKDGVDFTVFGPVFEPRSKSATLPPRGLAALREVTCLGVPVYALGGVSHDNAEACVQAGAVGIAGISVFDFRR